MLPLLLACAAHVPAHSSRGGTSPWTGETDTAGTTTTPPAVTETATGGSDLPFPIQDCAGIETPWDFSIAESVLRAYDAAMFDPVIEIINHNLAWGSFRDRSCPVEAVDEDQEYGTLTGGCTTQYGSMFEGSIETFVSGYEDATPGYEALQRWNDFVGREPAEWGGGWVEMDGAVFFHFMSDKGGGYSTYTPALRLVCVEPDLCYPDEVAVEASGTYTTDGEVRIASGRYRFSPGDYRGTGELCSDVQLSAENVGAAVLQSNAVAILTWTGDPCPTVTVDGVDLGTACP